MESSVVWGLLHLRILTHSRYSLLSGKGSKQQRYQQCSQPCHSESFGIRIHRNKYESDSDAFPESSLCGL